MFLIFDKIYILRYYGAPASLLQHEQRKIVSPILSVCPMPVLWRKDCTYRQTFPIW